MADLGGVSDSALVDLLTMAAQVAEVRDMETVQGACEEAARRMGAKRRTTQAVESLKAQWKNDPAWDIEQTEGFEAHREELHIYRLQQERRAVDAMIQKAALLGLTLHGYALFQDLQSRVERLEDPLGR